MISLPQRLYVRRLQDYIQRIEMRSYKMICGFLSIGALATAAKAQLFVPSSGVGIGEYDPHTGAPIAVPFISTAGGAAALDGKGNLFATNANGIGEYNASTGAPINASFITGLTGQSVATNIALDNSGHMFVASFDGTIGEYNASTGAAINSTFSTGLPGDRWLGLALDGNGHLFVSTVTENHIVEFNTATGDVINGDFVPFTFQNLLDDPEGLLIKNGILYVAQNGDGRVSEYDAVTGTVINASFITNAGVNATGIAQDENGDFYVSSEFGVQKFDSTGALINAFSITGLTNGGFLAVPEPSTLTLAGLAALGLFVHRRRK